MGLSKQEISEIDQLPVLLREKIFRVFQSPLYSRWDAFDTFISNKMNELKTNEFPILVPVSDKSEDSDIEKNAQKASTARQEAETALKYAKELPTLIKECEDLREMLTIEEQEKAKAKIVTAKDLRKVALGSKES